MGIKRRCEGSYLSIRLVFFLWAVVSSACVENKLDELSYSAPYSSIVGAEFRTTTDLYAYGVYEDMNRDSVAYITVLPGVGISGPEIAFKRQITKGQKIKILSAWQERGALSGGVFYQVSMHGSGLPQGTQIRIELTRGNEGGNAGLNPQFYENTAKELISESR
ncbi:MAG: hypothetical protein IPK65_01605 [Gammaproteobacteria bacterium]|nr:hypothetical protein [Gammaproteobacteria bacterium]